MTFSEVQVQDILDVQWGDTKTTKASYVPTGFLAYSATGPDGFLDKFDYECEGIVLSAIGANCGSTFFASGKWSCIKNTIRILPKSDQIDLKYFYYMTKASDFWPIRGSAQPFISQTDIRELYVQIPRIPVQRIIGEILFKIEQKIEVNNALSKTLEDIAQTIFKSWFIYFDPVKAKMNGEKPVGMDDETAALFPDSFEESELGLIPKGWNVQSLDEISDYLNGLAMQRFPVTDEENQLPVIKIAQLRVGNTSGADIASGSIDSKFVIQDGDILFSWSGTLEVETWAGGPGALNQHLFKVSGKTVPDWFSYLSTKYFLTFFRRIASSKATTMGHIQRSHLSESKIALPGKELMKQVSELLEPMITMKVNSLIESRTLAEIRDSLLPRLISGELQIPEEMLAS
jgi:type I restriction enzyme S subunit